MVLTGCFFVGMFVNGAVLAGIVSGPHKHPARAASPTPSVERAAVQLPRRAQVEQQVLLALVRSPGRLSGGLVDPATGLARTNLGVSCRRVEEARYTCHVRAKGAPGRQRLGVRFRPGRGGVDFVKEVVRRPL